MIFCGGMLAMLVAFGFGQRNVRVRWGVPRGGSEPKKSFEAPFLAAESPGAHALVLNDMVYIPGGNFVMGSSEQGAEPNESPLHFVRLSPYWLDATEVTVGAYRDCVRRGLCRVPTLTSTDCTYPRDLESLPMNCVSFDEADRFCLAHQKRLPTEAEWEFSARGEQTRVFPWGDTTPSCAHVVATLRGNEDDALCSPQGPQPVATRELGRSPVGALDLAGNLEEWVADWYDDRYPTTATVVDPHGPDAGFGHVVRGGSWQSNQNAVRSTARSWASYAERGVTLGFRCGRDVTP